MKELLSKNIELKDSRLDIIELPFESPVHLPFGSIETRPSAWLTVEGRVDGNDARGAAEGTSLPIQIPMYDDFSGNLAENIAHITSYLTDRPSSLANTLDTISFMELGGRYATARMTTEAALIDMVARSEGKSVASLLTEATEPSYFIPYGKSITENSYANILRACHDAVDNGAMRLKFKVSPQNFAELYPALKQLTREFESSDFMVDANGMFDPEDEEHLKMLRMLDSLGLLTIEEPVSRAGRLRGLLAHHALHDTMRLSTPITADDSIKSADDARYALDNNLAHVINLKPGRVGSFMESKRIADQAKERGKEIMVGGMFEATPGRMMTLTLAAYCLSNLGFKIPGDLSLPQERLRDDLVADRLSLNEQHEVAFTPKQGWGYDI